ncbi:universal stress protein [Natronolimnobius sp. AArcel1]|uniref:universal stress protein n=1 Tax=Natronolimnobius sp. AArcel1 TaxID=1679093 RepID=UPI0013EB90FF|nr:universal stress protein [Natronolimnobius sp. AArcel1]NGM69243.1 universal stress protein [Natronolimnobius sp. AArcel1]
MGNAMIIPTDGSEYAENAAEVGFNIAAKMDATIHALAVGDLNLTQISSVGGPPPKTKDDVTELAAGWATELVELAEDAGIPAEPVVRVGKPADEIATYAGEIDADMVVIGTAGRSGLERRLIGSVTNEVVQTAPVPVVTVRPDGSVDAA